MGCTGGAGAIGEGSGERLQILEVEFVAGLLEQF